MAKLTLDDTTKVFDSGGESVVAVDDISMEIDDGEFIVLVGPSGCGKTTSLRMIAGLESITDGEISIDDERVNEKPARERDIAMVFQSYALYPHMTVRGNMRFGLEESTDFEDTVIDEKVGDVAEMLDITDLLDRKPDELSGGQQQRVALGRAIVRDPDVFLMDEPLSNLDAKLRAQMRIELQRLQEELDVTTVYVTHDQTEAMTMGDRIAVLDGGELQQIGTPMDCYYSPANQFVAGFIGDPAMNFFPVNRQDSVLRHEDFEYPLSQENLDQLGTSTDLILGVRPPALELVDTPEDERTFEAFVDVVELLGDERAVHLSFEQSKQDDTFTAIVDGMHQVNQGETVAVRIPEDAIHLFDGRTGEAIVNPSRAERAKSESGMLRGEK